MNLRMNKRNDEEINDIIPLTIGKSYSFHTVGDITVGRIKNINDQWIVLSNSSSIAPINYHNFVENNKPPDVLHKADVILNIDAIIIAIPYNETLPRIK